MIELGLEAKYSDSSHIALIAQQKVLAIEQKMGSLPISLLEESQLYKMIIPKDVGGGKKKRG